MFTTCLWLVLDLFSTFSLLAYDLSWFVHNLFLTCLWLVHNLFTTFSLLYLSMNSSGLVHLRNTSSWPAYNFFMTCSGLVNLRSISLWLVLLLLYVHNSLQVVHNFFHSFLTCSGLNFLIFNDLFTSSSWFFMTSSLLLCDLVISKY